MSSVQRSEPDLALRSFAFERLSGIAAVLDDSGVIVDTNEAWRLFAQLNDGSLGATGPGVNYLEACDRAAADGSPEGAAASSGLREILSGRREHFDLEYPCSSPTEDRWFMLQASSAPVADRSGVVLFHVNITARKVIEERLATEAQHDELTGLANRRAGTRYLEQQLEQARVTQSQVWVLFMDLDRFKAVNDDHGHHVGDELLVQVAARSRRAVRTEDLVCRVGGDELFFVCPGLTPGAAAALSARLRDVMEQPFQIGATQISIGASIGHVASGSDSTADALLQAADAAMYDEKRTKSSVSAATSGR